MSGTVVFEPRRSGDVGDLIDAFPLTWIVSCGPEGRGTTVLPLLAERDETGHVLSLFGHFATSNPQVALLERQPEAMILAMGPQGYIAPRLVSKPTWGPTWNYAIVRFEVDIRFVPEENDLALQRLASALERNRAEPWGVDKMGPRYAELSRYIVAFRADIRETHARFKLGQDEAPDTFQEIVSGLDDAALAEWMIRSRA